MAPPGPESAGHGLYVVQAAIASLHADESTDWPQIAGLYGELHRLTGSPVVAPNRAVAVAETEGPQAALDIVDQDHCEPPLMSFSKYPITPLTR